MLKKAEVVIIGGGPAGMTAGIYASRSGADTVIVEKAQPGGQLWLSEALENFPGFPENIGSFELSAKMHSQAKNFGTEFITGEVKGIAKSGTGFSVVLSSGESLDAISVIIAAGAAMKRLGVEGEQQYTGKGVSYCAVCDGPLFRDRVVAVVGGGNTACEEAVFLTKFASKVYLIHRRDRLRASAAAADKVAGNSGIELMLEKEVVRIEGVDYVKRVVFKDGQSIDVNGVFIFVGLEPQTDFAAGLVDMEDGFIKTDKNLAASVPGIFAAGDCRESVLRQVITACGDGALAGEEARKYVEKMKGTAYDW